MVRAIRNYRLIFLLPALLGMLVWAYAGPVGPPAGSSLSPDDVILNKSAAQPAKRFNVPQATISTMTAVTINAQYLTLGGVNVSTSIRSGTTVYPATATASFPLGFSASTATFSGLVNGTTVTLTGIFNGAVIHGSSVVITGTLTGSNLSGTNTGDITIGTGSGLSISGQILSMTTASSVSTGSLKASDFTTFSNKLSPSGNGSALSGITATQVGLGNVQNLDQTDAANLTSGTVGTARLGSGSASSSKYLRGDQTWQTLNSTAAGLGNVTNDRQVKVADYAQKGGILVGISVGDFAVMPPGGNGTILQADSTQPTGYKFVISPTSFTVYPATATAIFPKGFSASTATFSGTITGADAHFVNGVFSGALSANNLLGTNSGDVTLDTNTSHGLYLTTIQGLNLSTSSASQAGALTAADWTRFDSKTGLTATGTIVGPYGARLSTVTVTTLGAGVFHLDTSSSGFTGPVSMSTETTGAFISSVNVSAALTVTANGANNSAITIGISPSSVTAQGNTFNSGSNLLQLSGGLVPTAQLGNAIINQSSVQSGATAYPDFLYAGSLASFSTVTVNGHQIQAISSTFTYTIPDALQPSTFSMTNGPSSPPVVTNSSSRLKTIFDNFDRSDRKLSGDLTPTGDRWVVSGVGVSTCQIQSGLVVSSANYYADLDYGSQIPKICGAFSFLPSSNPATMDSTVHTLVMHMDKDEIGLSTMLHLQFGIQGWGLDHYNHGNVNSGAIQGSYNLQADGTVYGICMEINGSSVTVRPPQGPAVTYSSGTIATTTYRYGTYQYTATNNTPVGRWSGILIGGSLSETNRALGLGKSENDNIYYFATLSSATISKAAISTLTLTTDLLTGSSLTAGTSGQILVSQGSGFAPAWSSTSLATIPSSQVTATTAGDNASNGHIGAYVSTNSTTPSNFAASATYQNYVSSAVPAGDWRCTGALTLDPGTAVNISSFLISISTFSGNTTTDQVLGRNVFLNNGFVAGGLFPAFVPMYRINSNVATTIYLKGRVTYTSGQPAIDDGGLYCNEAR